MAKEVISGPIIGSLTTTEIHAFVIGFAAIVLLGVTKARSMVRSEIWYALGGMVLGVAVIGALLRAGWL